MVNINQLFLIKPPQNYTIKIIKLLGFTSLKDKKEITIQSMVNSNTLIKMEKQIDKLKEYYLPCKHKLFLENLNLKKCITIARQLLKVYDYDIISTEKTIQTKKILYYKLIKKNDKEKLSTKKNIKKEYIIYFN
jgi:hypothetical protein